MKNFQNIKQKPSSRSLGFTVVEMIMVVGIFLFIFVGVMIGVQLFGLRIYTLEATKLVATQGARTAMNAMRDQIRESKTVYVGNCASEATNAFSLLAVTNIQQGNALIVYPTTNTSAYIVYYLDTSAAIYALNQFNVTNGQIVYTNQLAKYLTNLVVFDAENWQTGVATNYTSLDNREIIHVTMQFSQWQYPIAFIGTHGFNAYDYYQLRTRVFRRAWN